MRSLFALAILTLVSAGTSQRKTLRASSYRAWTSRRSWSAFSGTMRAAWSARDPAALAALFATDGFVLARGRPPLRGRRAIQEYYASHGGPLSLRAIAFASEGSVGYIIGGYAVSREGPDVGKFTLTLRKGSDGRWLIVSDMDNSNR